MRKIDRPLVVGVAVAFTVGCATSNARIYRTEGPPLSAEIESSDASTLVVLSPPSQKNSDEERRRVGLGQYQVSSIDHPGNVLAAAGLGSAGVGGALLTAWIVQARQPGRMDNGFGGLVAFTLIGTIAIGLGVFAFNSFVWGQSRAHARAFEQARPPARLIAPAVPGNSEAIAPLQPPLGTDDDDPSGKPRKGFHR